MKIKKIIGLVLFTLLFTSILVACSTGINFTIKFDSNGGTACISIQTDGTRPVQMPKNPTKANYTFDGWYWDNGMWNEPFTINSVLDKPISDTMEFTVYAKWLGNEYTITFDYREATSNNTTPNKKVRYGDNYTLIVPKKAGHLFLGWFYNDSGVEVQYTNHLGTSLDCWNTAKNITLYAKWGIDTLVVSFDKQEGEGTAADKTVMYNSTYGTLPTVTRTGYTFDGWWTGANGNGIQIISTTTVTITASQTLYAKWIPNEHKVSFNMQGGNGTAEDKTVVYNATYGTLPVVTKTGYTFSGWWTGVAGVGTQVTSTTTVKITETQTLYAKWTANNYIVSFDKQSGSGTANNLSVTYDFEYGILPVLTRFGYSFGGWWTALNDTGVQITSNSIVKVLGNQTLYAKWNPPIAKTVSAAGGACFMIDADGSLGAWGNNGWYTLGDGTQTNRNSPVQIKAGTQFVAVSTGGSHTLAIDKSGNLWAWGYNAYGQVGNDTTTHRSTPVQIKEGTKFIAISAGNNHSLAIDSEGNLWVWGYNYYGQLGDNTTVNKKIPVQIMAGTKFIAVSGDDEHSLAIDDEGNLWAWGTNSQGRLGDGTTTRRISPVQILKGSQFVSISAGYNHSLAIDSEGNLWAWGDNSSGQLGDGTKTGRTSPVQIMAGTKFDMVSTSRFNTLAIDSDGNLWGWGGNSDAQLGDGTKTGKTSPIQIMAGTKFIAVGSGEFNSVAIDSKGKIWTWGSNYSGQLGDGTNANKSSPVKIF